MMQSKLTKNRTRLIFLLFVVLIFSNEVLSQETEVKKDEKEITVCPIKLLVRGAEFRFSYRYIIKTNEKSEVIKIQQLNEGQNPRFIKEEDFIPCIKSWKLSPSEDYFVSISYGTIYADRNHILISSKKESIKINIASVETELVTADKKKKQK